MPYGPIKSGLILQPGADKKTESDLSVARAKKGVFVTVSL
jgi:hypothetical protein